MSRYWTATPPWQPTIRPAMTLFVLSTVILLMPYHLCATAKEVMVTDGFLHDNQDYTEQTILNLKGLDKVRKVTSVATVSNGKVNAELKISGMDNNAPETFATGLYMTVFKCKVNTVYWIWIEFLPPNAYIHMLKTTAESNFMRVIAIQTGWEYNTTVFVEDSEFHHTALLHAVRIFKPPAPAKHEFRDNCVLHIKKITVYDDWGLFSVADSPLLLYQQSALVFEDVKAIRCVVSILNLEVFELHDHSAFIVRNVVNQNSETNVTVVPFFRATTITVDETSVLAFVDIDTANGFRATTSKAIDVTKIDGAGTIVFARWLMQASGLTTLQPTNNANFWVSALTTATTDLTLQQLRNGQKFNVNMDHTLKWDGTGKDGACVPVGGGIPNRATYKLVDGKCVATCDPGYVPPACTLPATSQCLVDNCDLCYRITKTKCFVCASHTTHESDDTVCHCPIDDCRICPSATQCTMCQEGYNVSTTGNSCIRCSIDVPKCYHCTSPSLCDQCEPFYNTSADKKTCYDCHVDNCAACSADKVCSECAPKYNLTNPGKPNNRCMPCLLDNCLLCGSDNNCEKCADGSTKPAGGTGDCVPCNVKHCERCDTANECAQCPDKHTPVDGKHCYPCTMPGCLTCSGDEQCKECADGYTLVGTTCIRCSIDLPNCKECTTDGVCDQCQPSYNVSADKTTCHDCRIDNCLSCSADKVCSECTPGYNLTNPGKPNNGCMPCLLDNCVLCGSDNNCEKCADGSTKPAGGTGDCVPCNVKQCERCDTANECAQCLDKHTLVGTNQCYSCTMSGCLTCNGDEQCKECADGYTLTGSTCVGCNVPNCEFCSGNDVCAQCEDHYNVSADKTTCHDCRIDNCLSCSADKVCSECTPGYNLTNPGKPNNGCMPCLLDNCLLCGSDNNCEKCADGSTKPAGGTGDCVPCNVKHCERCDTANECAQCPDKHTLVGTNQCFSCTMPGCLACDDDEQCTACADNYTLYQKKCVECAVDHCTDCRVDGVCSVCDGSFSVALSGTECISCDVDHCTICSSSDVCGMCACGMVPNKAGDKCVPCMAANCKYCSVGDGDGKKCAQCVEGYAVRGDNNCAKVIMPSWAVFLIVVILSVILAAVAVLCVWYYRRYQAEKRQKARDLEERRQNRRSRISRASYNVNRMTVLDIGDIEAAASGVADKKTIAV